MFHRHHITYKPEKIILLCPVCHSIITGLNTMASIVVEGKVSNKNRLKIFDYFMVSKGHYTRYIVEQVINSQWKKK